MARNRLFLFSALLAAIFVAEAIVSWSRAPSSRRRLNRRAILARLEPSPYSLARRAAPPPPSSSYSSSYSSYSSSAPGAGGVDNGGINDAVVTHGSAAIGQACIVSMNCTVKLLCNASKLCDNETNVPLKVGDPCPATNSQPMPTPALECSTRTHLFKLPSTHESNGSNGTAGGTNSSNGSNDTAHEHHNGSDHNGSWQHDNSSANASGGAATTTNTVSLGNATHNATGNATG